MDYMGTDIKLNDNGEILISNNDFSVTSGIECRLQQIKIRLFTQKGALFYDQDFGSDLHKFINANKTKSNIASFKQSVKLALFKEPLIDNDSVLVRVDDSEKGFYAYVTFKFLDYDTVLNLVVNVDNEIKIWS